MSRKRVMASKFQNWICWFLRHNWNTRLEHLFTDCVAGEGVYAYRCKCGTTFMSNYRTWFSMKANWVPYDERDLPKPVVELETNFIN